MADLQQRDRRLIQPLFSRSTAEYTHIIALCDKSIRETKGYFYVAYQHFCPLDNASGVALGCSLRDALQSEGQPFSSDASAAGSEFRNKASRPEA